MTAPENWEKFERIFSHALLLEDEAARVEYVAEQTKGDEELRHDITRLLENDRQEHCFLDAPVAELGTKILAETEDEDLIGREDFASYHLLKILGRGGMGIVFLAHDTRLNRKTALKILPKTLGNHRETLIRFRQEAHAASNVAHPSVAHIYDFGEYENRYYLAMEYVRGRTLRELIKDKLIDENRALDFALQIASALQAAHRSGIVHRDIKPENVIVTDDNLVKVLDFGLAKIEPETNHELLTTMETVPGLIMGTTAYMSPEQVRGQRLDQQTDLWSLGVVLYEMLAGTRPFAGDTPSDLQAAILRDDVPTLAVGHRREFAPLLKNSLQKNRLKRFQTASDFIVEAKKAQTALTKKTPQNWHLRDWFLKAAVPLLIVFSGLWGAANLTENFSFRQNNQPIAKPSLINEQIKSLVVPPFVNLTDDARMNFLSEGLAEDLTRSLGSLNRVRVVSYSSARKLKDAENLETVKNSLPVDAILRGRIERDGERLSISVELINLTDEKIIWQDKLNAPINDLLKLRNGLTTVIADKFQTLTGGEKQIALTDYGTRNNAAYLKYLEGKYAPDRATETGARRAVEPLKKAIELDPNYALAYVALADAYNLLAAWFGERPEFYFPLAEKTLEKAIEIDPNLSEAHTSFAKMKMDYKRDFAAAETEFNKAIELNQNNALAHHWFGEVYLSAMGRLDESLRELETAHQLDPLSSGVLTALAWTRLGRREYETAIENCDAALLLNPQDTSAYSYKSMALIKLERYDEAIATAQKAADGEDGNLELGVACALAGQTEKTRAMIAKLEREKPRGTDISDYDIAVLYAALGEKDKAFRLLEKEAESKSVDLLSIRIDPLLDTLRDDARFAALESKLHLPLRQQN